MPRKSLRTILYVMFVFILSGCQTTGKMVQQAQFDGDNTQAIVLSPIYLPDPQEVRSDHAWALTLKVSDGAPYFGLIRPSLLLTDPLFSFFASLGLKSGGAIPENSAEYKMSGCQGQALVQTAFDGDGAFTGSIQFQNYADNCSLVFDTSVPFQGQLNPDTGQLVTQFDFKDLQGKMGQRNYLLAGQLQFEMSAFAGTEQKYQVKGSLSLDETNGQKYRFEEMHLSWDLSKRYPHFSMSGKIASSEYGMVEVVTNSPFISYEKDSPPFDGMLTFTGNDGAWRRLYFPKSVDPGAFRIDGSNGMKTMGKF